MMSKQEHIERHQKLHRALDELFADFIQHNPKKGNFTMLPIRELIEWSNLQTENPTEETEQGGNCDG